MDIKKWKTVITPEHAAIFAFCLYAFEDILCTTQVGSVFTLWPVIQKLCMYASLLLAGASFALAWKVTLRTFLLGVLLAAVFLPAGLASGRLGVLVFTAAFILMGIHLESEKLLKAYAVMVSVVIIFTLVLYFAGIYEYDVLIDKNNRTRLYLGFLYTTYIANYFFHAYLAWTGARKKDITVPETVVILVANQLIMYATDTKAVYYEIILLLIALWVLRLCGSLYRLRITGCCMIIAMPVFSVIICMLSAAYDPSIAWMKRLNSLLTNRLYYGRMAIDEFGFNLFGHQITWVTGRKGIERTADYFYVDASYLNAALVFGVAVMVLLVAGFTFLMWKACAGRQYFLCIALLFLALHSLTDPQLFDLKHDPFLVLIGTALLREGALPFCMRGGAPNSGELAESSYVSGTPLTFDDTPGRQSQDEDGLQPPSET